MAFLGIAAGSAYAMQYEVRGVAEIRFTGATNQHALPETSEFLVAVQDSQWRIETTYQSGNTEVNWCDGTNVFKILYANHTLRAKGGTLTIENQPPRVKAALITPGMQPVDATWHTHLPWFAFASGGCINSTNWLVPPWASARTEAVANALTTKIKTLNTELNLPERAVFTVSSDLKSRLRDNPYIGTEPQYKRVLQSIEKDFANLPDGRLTAEYAVTETTNCNGIELPLAATLQYYLYSKLYPQTRIITVQMDLRITDVSELRTKSLKLDFNDVLSVVDFRVQNRADKIDYVAYDVTNNAWPKVSDPLVRSAYAAKSGSAAWLRRLLGVNPLRMFFYTLLGAGLVLPPLDVWVRPISKEELER